MGKLNAEKILKELNEKWRGQPCPYCGGNWVISNKVFELREFQNGNIVIGVGPIQPVVPVTCDNCGNTVLINPLVLGALEE